MELIYYAWTNYGIPAIVVSLLTVIVTFGLKIPYKLLTAKIEDEALRKLANTPITFFPFGVGIALWLAYLEAFGLPIATDEFVVAGVICGAVAVIIYVAFGAKIEVAVRQAIGKQKDVKKEVEAEIEVAEQVSEIVKNKKSAKNIVDDIKSVFKKKVADKNLGEMSVEELYEKLVKKSK